MGNIDLCSKETLQRLLITSGVSFDILKYPLWLWILVKRFFQLLTYWSFPKLHSYIDFKPLLITLCFQVYNRIYKIHMEKNICLFSFLLVTCILKFRFNLLRLNGTVTLKHQTQSTLDRAVPVDFLKIIDSPSQFNFFYVIFTMKI